MTRSALISRFSRTESGAITVDWTVLAAAMTAMCLATAALMNDNFNMLGGMMDAELRDRQMQDDWVEFYASHFEAALETGYITEDQAQAMHDLAASMSTNNLRDQLEAGITALENGTITTDELVELVAIASVAQQLNLVDEATMDTYFGFSGGEPQYMNSAAAPSSTGTYQGVAAGGTETAGDEGGSNGGGSSGT
ncbi:hypothetical protein [Gymnodinialimonas ulvae]|uniref:hypothetical protein n=1 Tax=Gymnodinialimonas ulvae TaxID=3126504 RepID=UPI00309A789B